MGTGFDHFGRRDAGMLSKLFDGCGLNRRDRDKYSDWSGMAGLSQGNNLQMHEAGACLGDGVPHVTLSFWEVLLYGDNISFPQQDS